MSRTELVEEWVAPLFVAAAVLAVLTAAMQLLMSQ